VVEYLLGKCKTLSTNPTSTNQTNKNKKSTSLLGMMMHDCNPSTQKLRQEDHEFEASIKQDPVSKQKPSALASHLLPSPVCVWMFVCGCVCARTLGIKPSSSRELHSQPIKLFKGLVQALIGPV
jgi:hypothetical protein